jgi:hypothetical protein
MSYTYTNTLPSEAEQEQQVISHMRTLSNGDVLRAKKHKGEWLVITLQTSPMPYPFWLWEYNGKLAALRTKCGNLFTAESIMDAEIRREAKEASHE